MIFLPNGEEVSLVLPDPPRKILKVLKATGFSPCLHNNVIGAAEKFDPISCDESILLTKLDIINRLQGYSRFLPDTKEKCDDYWRLCYGIELRCDTGLVSDENNRNEYNLIRIIMELGDTRIVPVQLLARSHICSNSSHFIISTNLNIMLNSEPL